MGLDQVCISELIAVPNTQQLISDSLTAGHTHSSLCKALLLFIYLFFVYFTFVFRRLALSGTSQLHQLIFHDPS